MTQLIDPAATDAAVNAFYRTISRLVELSPGMHQRQSATGTRLIFTGLPMSSLNLVCVGTEPDLDEVDAFVKELSTTDVPWSIQLRTRCRSRPLRPGRPLRQDVIQHASPSRVGR
ncbi:hypothetical protein ACH4C2_34780 [Streptomyces sp. NPDC018057]|uniref:hypothetical protein n=1 Tax=unclassified Streptomyces TaxID=2593676 RepID=UPI0037B2F0E1